MSNEIKDFIEGEKAALNAVLHGLGAGSEEMRAHAASALDLSAAILAAKLQGQDTTIAEASLTAVRSNLVSASSSMVAQAVSTSISGILIRVATIAGKVLLAL